MGHLSAGQGADGLIGRRSRERRGNITLGRRADAYNLERLGPAFA